MEKFKLSGYGSFRGVTLKVAECVTSINKHDVLYALQRKFNCSRTNVIRVELPSSLKEIGCETFMNFDSLETVYNPSISQLKLIGCSAFKGCTELKEFTIPTGVRSVEKSTFSDCTSLRKVIIPTGVHTIGERAFENCVTLEEVRIPNTVRTIEKEAFSHCVEMKRLILDEGIDKIYDRAFKDCASLTEVVIPSTLRWIGVEVFDGCINLKKIIVSSHIYKMLEPAISGVNPNVKIVKTDKPQSALAAMSRTIGENMQSTFARGDHFSRSSTNDFDGEDVEMIEKVSVDAKERFEQDVTRKERKMKGHSSVISYSGVVKKSIIPKKKK